VLEVKILKVDEQIEFGQAGRIVSNMRIQFMVGDHGPFLELVPKEGFTMAAGRAAVDARAREIQGLVQG